VVLVRERDLLLTYQKRTGALPVNLADAGSTAPDLDYRRDGTSFAVTGHAGDSSITIRSTDSVTAFLGDSFSRLRNRNAP
jgi:hypothetical protein